MSDSIDKNICIYIYKNLKLPVGVGLRVIAQNNENVICYLQLSDGIYS